MINVKKYFKALLIPAILGGIIGFIISGYLDYEILEKPLLVYLLFFFECLSLYHLTHHWDFSSFWPKAAML